MRKGFGEILLVLVVAAALGAGVYFFGVRNRPKLFVPPSQPRLPNATSTMSATSTASGRSVNLIQDETSGWVGGGWQNIDFSYPPGWTLKKIYYKSGSESGEGLGQEVGVVLTPPKPQSHRDYIGIDGYQISCNGSYEIGTFTRCVSLLHEIHTSSERAEIIKFFDLFLGTIRPRSSAEDAISITSPLPREEWGSGKEYAVEWQSPKKFTNAAVRLWDPQEHSYMWDSQDVKNEGSYKFAFPYGDDSLSRPQVFGPYLVEVRLTGGGVGSAVATSGPLYVISFDGKPYFDPAYQTLNQ